MAHWHDARFGRIAGVRRTAVDLLSERIRQRRNADRRDPVGRRRRRQRGAARWVRTAAGKEQTGGTVLRTLAAHEHTPPVRPGTNPAIAITGRQCSSDPVIPTRAQHPARCPSPAPPPARSRFEAHNPAHSCISNAASTRLRDQGSPRGALRRAFRRSTGVRRTKGCHCVRGVVALRISSSPEWRWTPMRRRSGGELEPEQREGLGEVRVGRIDWVLCCGGERVGGFPDRPVLEVVAES